jgi:hypothetical protein
MRLWQTPVITFVVIPALGAAASHFAGPVLATTPGLPAQTQQACAEFEAYARLDPRTGEPHFATMLAGACHDAIQAVRGGAGARQTARAWAFLMRLTDFHRTIAGMNAAYASASPAERAHMRPVSETGAYLIAHQMGVLAAWDDWTAASGTPVASR